MKDGPLILVGFMGTGKTEVGHNLAIHLNVPFLDIDAEIVSEAGFSIPEIFEQDGEAGFRRRERAVFLSCLERSDSVVSCGGGIVVTPENLEDLKQQPNVFCLTATPETIVSRIGQDPNRPLLQGAENPMEQVRTLLKTRQSLYDELPFQLATDDLRPSEVVERILSELRNPASG